MGGWYRKEDGWITVYAWEVGLERRKVGLDAWEGGWYRKEEGWFRIMRGWLTEIMKVVDYRCASVFPSLFRKEGCVLAAQ